MNEWPLQKSWVLYHGELLGFENLYVLDSSTDARCLSFLRYARDILGTNVIFSDANLNEMTAIMTDVAKNIAGSSDLIIKMDTDEFLVVYDNSTNSLTTSIPSLLSGFVEDGKHSLRLTGHSRVGYIQSSIPSEDVCKENVYSTPDKFPLADFSFIGTGNSARFKAVFDSRQPFGGDRVINLGGHAVGVEKEIWTSFGIIHYHSRCLEIEVEICKRVLERHNYIKAVDDSKQILKKLIKMLKCPSTPEDFCDTCTFGKYKTAFASSHKALFYSKWLSCPERLKKGYYHAGSGGTKNANVINTMETSHAKFDI